MIFNNLRAKSAIDRKHYLILLAIIFLGAALRFWQLELKPLWIDEVVTFIFSLGRNYRNVPIDVIFTPQNLQDLFIFKPEVSCREIAGNIITQSTHPPLFFCLMHDWLSWLQPLDRSLLWKLRALPALIGVATIVAIYYLNRLAFSPAAGLMGAAIMAVSPFGVYISQEARHYTLPVLFITLSLICLSIAQKDLERGERNILVWLSWSIINGISFYVHYFCLLAFVAQTITILIIIYQYKVKRLLLPLFSCILPIIIFLPWLPIFIEHSTSPKTSWLPSPENIAPIYQIILAWLLMVIALPIENQPSWMQICSGLLSVGFGGWIFWQFWRGLQQNWRRSDTFMPTLTLICFTLTVLLELFAIVYLLGKDITVAPRYNFIYYPAVCALLGASFTVDKNNEIHYKSKIQNPKSKILLLLFVCCLSSIFVVFNFVFQKPYQPELVAQQFNRSPEPVTIVVGYGDPLDLALGLSYFLELAKIRPDRDTSFYFADRAKGYNIVWQKLSELSVAPKNLWVVAPGLKRVDYPQMLKLGRKNTCQIDPEQHYRIGVPYQLYRCNL
jgi:uncharacterized membrane protein